jgi:DNA invertase Pin-like site-specific DNA recombinase
MRERVVAALPSTADIRDATHVIVVYVRVSTGKQVEEGLGLADQEVVYRLDRLARDLVLQEQLLAEVWRSRGAVLDRRWGGEPPRRPEDPSRRLLRQVLGAVSEDERAMIALRRPLAPRCVRSG